MSSIACHWKSYQFLSNHSRYLCTMVAKWVRMRVGRSPSVEQAITRPDISFLQTPADPVRICDSGGHSPSVIFAADGPNILEHYDGIFELLSPSYRLICLEMPRFGFSSVLGTICQYYLFIFVLLSHRSRGKSDTPVLEESKAKEP
jgi:hypothetical protein